MKSRDHESRPEVPSALDWAARAGVVPQLLDELEVQLRRRRQRKLRTAAVAVMAVMLLAVGLRLGWPHVGASTGQAVVSLPPRQVLPDGSEVELRPGAEIRVAFTPAIRRVELLAGEAHFAVAKNPQRPFVVAAGKIDVRAVGTAFVVQRDAAGVELLVTEGRVAVDRPSAQPAESVPAKPEAPLALVAAGNRTMVAAAADPGELRVEAVDAAELARRLAWRVPRLEFSSTPLDEVVALVNRHSRVHLVLGEAKLAELRVSGVVRADNVPALLQLLRADFGLVARARASDELVLERGE